jgi:integrase
MKAKISQTLVAKAKHDPARDIVYWDPDIKGFGLKVAKSGVMTYVYSYRDAAQQKRRISIGRCSHYKAEEARRIARDYRLAVDAGCDPLQAKQEAREAQSLGEMLDDYMASARFKERARSTQGNDSTCINAHLKPTIGKVLLKELRPEHVRKAIAAIRDGKTARDVILGPRRRSIVKGGEGIARKTARVLRAALNWAIGEGKLSENPARLVKIGTDGIRDTIISADEYKLIFAALVEMQEQRKLPDYIADAIRVIALTGARRGEIAKLKWSNVQDGKLVLQEHKTKSTTGKARTVQLPSAAQAIIARQIKSDEHDFVFAPSGKVSDMSHYWSDVRAHADVNPKITLHTMRHSLASGMAMQGFSAAEIMNTLGHSQLGTSQKYIHWAEQEQAKLADRASASIAAAMEGKPTAKLAKLRAVK